MKQAPMSLDWSDRKALYAFAALLGLVLVALSLQLAGPQAQADEGSYLLGAAAIAGKLATNPAAGYYSGYSLLFAPAFLFSADPDRVFRAALIVNALLTASIPIALDLSMRQVWPALGARMRLSAVAAAACYAPLLMMSQYAMTESALAAFNAWLIAAAAVMLVRPRVRIGVAIGVISGALYLVHPRGALMAAPVLLVLSLHARSERAARAPVAVAWGVLLVVAAMHGPLESLALKPIDGGYPGESMLTRLAHASTWKWIGLNFVGATTEGTIATLGMLVVAMRMSLQALCETMRAPKWRMSAPSGVLIACALSTIAALLITAAFFVPPTRADTLAYGRYALPTLIPMIALAVVRLGSSSRTLRMRDAAWAIAIGVAGCATMALAFEDLPDSIVRNWNYLNSIELYLVQSWRTTANAWVAIGICFFVLASAFLLVAVYRSRMAGAVFAAFNLFVAAYIWQFVTLDLSRAFAMNRNILAAAHGFESSAGGPLCLNVDPAMDTWNTIDFSWRLLPHFAMQQNRCTLGVILDENKTPPPGMRLVTKEHPSPQGKQPVALYVEEGPSLDRFAQTFPMWNPNAVAPLPPEDRKAVIALVGLGDGDITYRAKETLHWNVRVTNVGAHAWPAHADDGRIHPVMLGAIVTLADGRKHNNRATLPVALAPGESVVVPIDIGPVSDALALNVHVGVVQEQIAWFDTGVDLTIRRKPE